MAVAPSNETTGAHRCSFSRHRSSYIQHTSIADAMYSHYERLYTSYAEALLVLCWFCAGRSPGLCWFRCFVLVLCWSLLVSAGFAVLCWFCGGLCWSLPVSLFCAGFVMEAELIQDIPIIYIDFTRFLEISTILLDFRKGATRHNQLSSHVDL